jgi:YHS domain-containing protein
MTHQDPVCGMPVAEAQGVLFEHEGERLWFCSEFCRQQFLRHPRTYAAEPTGAPRAVEWPARRVAYFSMEVVLSNDIPTCGRHTHGLRGSVWPTPGEHSVEAPEDHHAR